MLRAFVGVLFFVFTVVGMATAGGPVGAEQTRMQSSVESQEFERTTFRINVSENGSARWTVMYRYDLSNETERKRFTTFASEFNVYANFKEQAWNLIEMGNNETGRQMRAIGFTRQAYVGHLNNSGIIEMSFLWTNFSVVTDDRIIIGDVFGSDLYIGSNQRLTVTWGENLSYSSASPTPDDRSADTVTWIAGEDGRKFNASEPKVVLQRSATKSESGLKAMITEALNNTSMPWIIGLAVLALVIVGGGVAYRTSAIGTELPDEADTVTSSSTATIAEEELMADEDRVLMLLRNNDGRMRQANIVNETNWSKSKVSMLLSDMDDEDLISKLQVGRENIISITGNEPEAARSPFEDEE
jgi:hypothetical protein